MMKVKIIVLGKHDRGFIEDAINEYTKRLQSVVDLEFVILKEEHIHESEERVKIDEGDKIIKAMAGEYFTVLLDETGKEFTSQQFAQKIEQLRDFEGGKIAFIIGGALGVSDDVKEAVDMKVALSKMTFTHQMVRVFLLEQLYRAFQILQGTGYHKD